MPTLVSTSHTGRPATGLTLSLVALIMSSAQAADPVPSGINLPSPKRNQFVTPGAPVLAPWQFNPDSGQLPVREPLFSGQQLTFQLDTSWIGTASRSDFNPDTGVSPITGPLFPTEVALTMRRVISRSPAPQAPPVFNPDPGAQPVNAEREPFFHSRLSLSLEFGQEPLDDDLKLPRSPVTRSEIIPVPPVPTTLTEKVELPPGPLRRRRLVTDESAVSANQGDTAIPEALQLPRSDVRANQRIGKDFSFDTGSSSSRNLPLLPNTEPRPDRARIGFVPWRRYTSGDTETAYESPEPYLWHPYKQSILKGDVPVIGQNIFLNLTASTLTEVEARRLPTPSSISSARPDSAEFFGQGEQFSIQNNVAFSVDLFQGETAFKPVTWALHLQPVYNLNYTRVRETTVLSPDPRGNTGGNNTPPPDNTFVTNPGDIDTLLNGQLLSAAGLSYSRSMQRTKDQMALQEAFFELHLRDLSANYDFISARFGNQPFNSDFRGFIFNDTNLGARLFGNADNNLYQYNLAAFSMLEKDTYSGLNTFNARDQRVFVANLYRQDFLVKGYTAQLSFHANLDDGRIHYDRNGNIARPEPLGTVQPHDVRAYYLGWAGDGHLGRFNLTHAFYQVYGHDDFNGLAGRPVSINAQMAALELSYDRDWIRYKASFFYASGDRHPEDGHATGFDSILDNPNFTGGPFSYYVHQGFNLAGTSVNLKSGSSLIPDLRTSKTEGQSNFVNPGLLLLGLGAEVELTPKLRSFLNLNYLRFAETDPIKTALLTDKVNNELGWDLSIGFQYRPFLTDNVIISTGFGTLLPGKGYRDIYRKTTETVPGYTPTQNPGQTDDFLFNAVFAVTFTY